jgi:hypothetical protein
LFLKHQLTMRRNVFLLVPTVEALDECSQTF